MDKDGKWIRPAQDSIASANCTNLLNNGAAIPVIAGLAIGVALIVLFAAAFSFKPAMAKSDSELMAEMQDLAAVKYLTSKYPDAQVIVERHPNENLVEVQYLVERVLCTPTPDAFGDNCIKTLYLGVTMKQLGHPAIVSGCLGPISSIGFGDPIKYIESNDCFDGADDGNPSSVITNGINQIDLTIEGLQSTYKTGEHIVFSVNAKGVSDNACNINSPSVYMRDESSAGKIIYWPNPFALYTAMGCNGSDPIDKTWTYGDDAESEIILDKAGSYTVIVSLEDTKIEKKFVITS